jgi:hypothetical protein
VAIPVASETRYSARLTYRRSEDRARGRFALANSTPAFDALHDRRMASVPAHAAVPVPILDAGLTPVAAWRRATLRSSAVPVAARRAS